MIGLIGGACLKDRWQLETDTWGRMTATGSAGENFSTRKRCDRALKAHRYNTHTAHCPPNPTTHQNRVKAQWLREGRARPGALLCGLTGEIQDWGSRLAVSRKMDKVSNWSSHTGYNRKEAAQEHRRQRDCICFTLWRRKDNAGVTWGF